MAGATGYLGRHIVKELQSRDLDFAVIARDPERMRSMGVSDQQISVGEVTQPDSIKEAFNDVDTVISTVGITRQKDGLTYMDVDYQANVNLLTLAQLSQVKRFIYISVINGEKMRDLKIMAAKEKFVDALKSSGINYTVIRPNGFFSDMKDFLDMARNGKVYLFGNGDLKLNPIHGADLAKVVVDVIKSGPKEIEVGGPDLLTQNEIGNLALEAHNKSGKIIHVPNWVRQVLIQFLRAFTSSKTYGPVEFFLTMMAQDNIAPRSGVYRLKKFFFEEVDQLSHSK